ncbi:MAG: RagB/SusD family nutrient uptake outer membrane protein [Muribaculaceae bacterium]|nr:RagB/SusD family nutrient uptake outer membrane protein [Muribaculaceae bacterium]
MKLRIYLSMAAAALIGLSSCSDFLEQENTYQASEEGFFTTDESIRQATAPLYNYVWNDFNGKFYYSVGDGRSNNLTARWSDYIYPYTNFTETSLSPGLEDAWGSFYSVIAQCNYVISDIENKAGDGVSEEAKIQGIAEARFMRGLAYWYLGSVWNKAIIYTDTKEQINHSVVPANRGVDVIEFGIRDLEFAAKNLSKTASDPGRVTSYSAYGILSRLYLSMAGLTTDGIYDGTNIATDFNRGYRNQYYLDLAAQAALKCIEGPYSLLPEYGDLFTVAQWNNNAESVFQLQWLDGATSAIGWGCNNSISAFFSWSTMVGETNWGNATYASYDIVRTYDPKDRKRRHATIATVGEYYPNLNVQGGGYIYNETESGYDNKCNVVKHVIGTNKDNGISYQQSSGVNTYMMRLAEVYLNYAEAVMGNNESTKDAEALKYFNMVRRRAGMDEKRTLTYEDIHYERRIELAYEGQYWYDLLRRSYYRQQEVVNYLNAQERNAGYEWDENEVCQYAKTSDGTGVSTATAYHLTLPLSDVDLGRNPMLNQSPVPYEFGEREVLHSELF